MRAAFPDALVDDVARAVAVGPLPEPRGTVCVVAAGTSDAPVAAEAAFVARAFGATVDRVDDVGVAGIHRLMAVRDRLDAADCLVVVAGMEGALPSVVGGLTGVPLVAVPTSVGYGTSYGGLAALLAMLNSCAPGVVVCNIDNGFGAGVFAARVARRGGRAGLRVTVAWVDASAGASGDMLLGALVGAGADLAVLQAAVDALGTEPVRLTARPVTRAGLAATQVEVAAPASDVRRTWPDVRALIEGADLADPVRDRALDVFARLARAEAAAHGIARRRGALPRGRRARLAGRRRRRLRGAARPVGQRGALHRRWPSGRAACGPSTGCSRCRGPRSSRCSPRSGHRSGPATSTARRARRPARRCWPRR